MRKCLIAWRTMVPYSLMLPKGLSAGGSVLTIEARDVVRKKKTVYEGLWFLGTGALRSFYLR